MDGSWGMDGDRMGEHGIWAHLSKCYMFWWGYVLGVWVAQALKHMPNRLLKCEMFQWVVGFKVQVLRLMFCGMQFLIDQNEC